MLTKPKTGLEGLCWRFIGNAVEDESQTPNRNNTSILIGTISQNQW
ncbi:MAG: hypothetical protein F6K32_06055 [Desertifilum sp. SIO1I2]|nr:hypothetical protein [Desertifilum sp. SIO1I2]